MTERQVRPRGVWGGLVLAVAGSVVLGVAVTVGSWVLAAVGGVGLLAGATLGWAAGGQYDVHARGALGGELDDVRKGRAHLGVKPGDMVHDPTVRRTSRRIDRRRERIRAEREAAPEPPLAPGAAAVLLLTALFLLVSQWTLYPLGRLPQENATRALGVAIVAGLAGLRCRTPGRHLVAPAVAGAAGAGLILAGALAEHESEVMPWVEISCGAVVVLAAITCAASPAGVDDGPGSVSLRVPPGAAPLRSVGHMSISKGDRVRWNTSQGPTTGIAKEKRTSPFQHDKQQFKASEDEPYWIVESEKTGSSAAHKASTLSKA